MARNSKLISLTATALVAVALAACSGAVAGGPGSTPGSTPIPAPASPAPADPGDDAMPIKVDLDNATGHDVYVDIVDRSGRITGASSGKPGDGASVPSYEVKVVNVDDRTIRLTWSDLPGDNAVALFVDEAGTGLVLVQPEHDGDSMPFDRILVLEYDGPISAGDLRVTIQDGVDTPG